MSRCKNKFNKNQNYKDNILSNTLNTYLFIMLPSYNLLSIVGFFVFIPHLVVFPLKPLLGFSGEITLGIT